jgi:hypothetical protein
MKKRTLNGLPNSLEQRYFSTLFYYSKGYMADWIWNAADRLGVSEIEIDILNDAVTPRELEMHPIVAQLKDLRETIRKTLLSNQFPEDYITEARFAITIPEKGSRWFTCIPTIKDKDGKKYVGKTYWEQAMETGFSL